MTRPRGSAPGQKSSASRSLTATGISPPCLAHPSSGRAPATTGIPMTPKYPGMTVLTSDRGGFAGSYGSPCTSSWVQRFSVVKGRSETMATPVTPGTAPISRHTSRKYASTSSPDGCVTDGTVTSNATRPSGSKPGGTPTIWLKERVRSEATTTSAVAIATWLTMRRSCVRPGPRPARSPPSTSPARRSVEETRRATGRPKRRPDRRATAAVPAMTRRSTSARTSEVKKRSCTDCSASALTTRAMAPTAAPASARTTASASTWRTNLERPDPSAARTASSRPRSRPRASVRLARLEQTIRSTTTPAARSRRRTGRAPPMR